MYERKRSQSKFQALLGHLRLCRAHAVADTIPHIVVLGAGLIGLCTADSLAAKGARVTVIEARPGPCEGTSFANSGMIHPSQACSWAKDNGSIEIDLAATRVTADLGQHSADLLKRRRQELGMPARPDGCIQIYPDLDKARAAQSNFDAIGVRADILVDPIETLGQPACVFPNDLSGNAHVFGCALAEDLKSKGVTFLYGIENFGVRETDEGNLKVMAGEDRLTCDHLVLAAGIRTPEILSTLNIRMPLESVAGVAVNFARPADSQGLPTRPVMDAETRTALTIFEDHVRLSGGWNVKDPAIILARWVELAPDLMRHLGEPLSTWVGHRPVSPVGRPYISETSIPGIWVNTGHGHMGWTLCAGSGDLLARMILEGHEDGRFAFAG